MQWFHFFSILIVLSASFSYFNYKYVKLPTSIGLMLVSLIFSLVVLVFSHFIPGVKVWTSDWLNSINFSELLLDVMLSFLLFAGALHIHLKDLRKERLSILMFSTISVILSTLFIGVIAYYLLPLFGFHIDLLYCIMFGALISPTDPIAVLNIMKKVGISKSLETQIAGESLFNDGVGVVIFMTLKMMAAQSGDLTSGMILGLFAQEVIGGLLLGAIVGYVGYKMITNIDNYEIEIMITLGIVMGGYTAAHFLHVSGPLAMVVAGLITGNPSREMGMSQMTSNYIDRFWDLSDYILNAVLFVLMGLGIQILEFTPSTILLGLTMIVVVVVVRYISLWIPSLFIRFRQAITRRTLIILTWGGLRGGISIALALTLRPEYGRDLWVEVTYMIVCFSILVQGTTVSKLKEDEVVTQI